MTNWKEYKFGELIEFPPKVKIPKNMELPFIDMELISSERRYVTNNYKKKFGGSASKFENNDILFARITPCLENRKIAQAKIDGKGFGSTEFFVFRANKEKLDQSYLYYLSKRDYIVENAINSFVGASGRQRADEKFIKRILVNIPPRPTQRKIAAILSTYDDLIENNNKRIAILEKMAEEIYKEWFVRMRFPGYKNKKFVKGIPEGWEIKNLKTFCKKVTDGTHDTPKPVNEGYPLVTGKNLKNGRIDFSNTYLISNKDYMKISNRSGVNEGDILFSNIGTVGSIAIVNSFTDYSVKNVIIFKQHSSNDTFFLYLLLRQKHIQDEMQIISSGASQQFIGLEAARSYNILVPSQNLRELFANFIDPMLKEKINLENQNDFILKIRDLLHPRLLSGKLSVENLDIIFPPSMENANA